MPTNDKECFISIPLARYEELVATERDANRLKLLIAKRAKGYSDILHSELKVLRDTFLSEAKEEAE